MLIPSATIQEDNTLFGFTVLFDQTLQADAANFDVQNIPQNYKHLMFLFHGRGAAALASTGLNVIVNNDSGANYDLTYLYNLAGTPQAGSSDAATSMLLGDISAASAPAGAAGLAEGIFANYASTTFWKQVVIRNVMQSATNTTYIESLVNNWRSTSPITRLTFSPASGNFLAGSRLTIYGLAGSPYFTFTTPDGWTSDSDPWTYVSSTTFTVPSDNTAQFSKGTRIRLFNQSTKYLVVTGSSYSGGVTTVTVTGGDDYSLANAAITDTYYSYAASPQGFPGFFNWPTGFGATGFSSLPFNIVYFSITGSIVTFYLYLQGTSNATTITGTLPVTSAQTIYGLGRAVNNGVTGTAPGAFIVSTGASSVDMYRDVASLPWTNSGDKRFTGQFTFNF